MRLYAAMMSLEMGVPFIRYVEGKDEQDAYIVAEALAGDDEKVVGVSEVPMKLIMRVAVRNINAMWSV